MRATSPLLYASLSAIGGAAACVAAAAVAQVQTVESEAGAIVVEHVARGLEHPWGMAFLPDGALLVTERAGRLRIINPAGELSDAVPGVPRVFAEGQGGLLDVALDPDFERSRLVYLSYSEPADEGATTALGRGRLVDGRIEGFEVIFRQSPPLDEDKHFGSRIVFAPDGDLFLTLGERFQFEPAQDLSNTLGTIVRLHPDGSVPDDNPFVGRDDAAPEIWSYGHRNIESAAIHPQTGQLWVAEMGPRGGDELNLPQPGENYGWPIVSWGEHYDGRDIPDPPTEPRFADAIRHWTPVISPSGMAFYTGDRFPTWRGSVLIGGLSSQALVRLEIEGDEVTAEERLELGARIRDVEQAPDGTVYLLTDHEDGDVLRLVPRD
jgi:glucose/arabinose dehydrogenase